MNSPASSARQLDVQGPVRPLLLAVFGWVAQMERDRIAERTEAGLATARANGKPIGRPKVSVDMDLALRLIHREGLSIANAAQRMGIGVATLHRALRAA